ncbi:hypothetical protein EYF80_035462 [Liparis tanakae]|uniref:Uncharacterized protein n=1 Tax=Liparis tanakae TaxID=230148 RepID=A0A4Z2GNT3_9TELE|nr:hypothetical protein EYF80_035462 [Liparis tanakae]
MRSIDTDIFNKYLTRDGSTMRSDPKQHQRNEEEEGGGTEALLLVFLSFARAGLRRRRRRHGDGGWQRLSACGRGRRAVAAGRHLPRLVARHGGRDGRDPQVHLLLEEEEEDGDVAEEMNNRFQRHLADGVLQADGDLAVVGDALTAALLILVEAHLVLVDHTVHVVPRPAGDTDRKLSSWDVGASCCDLAGRVAAWLALALRAAPGDPVGLGSDTPLTTSPPSPSWKQRRERVGVLTLQPRLRHARVPGELCFLASSALPSSMQAVKLSLRASISALMPWWLFMSSSTDDTSLRNRRRHQRRSGRLNTDSVPGLLLGLDQADDVLHPEHQVAHHADEAELVSGLHQLHPAALRRLQQVLPGLEDLKEGGGEGGGWGDMTGQSSDQRAPEAPPSHVISFL